MEVAGGFETMPARDFLVTGALGAAGREVRDGDY
jgi:hypothetical protein